MSSTTSVEPRSRTVRGEDWANYVCENPVKEESINSTIWKVMAELHHHPSCPAPVHIKPWPYHGKHMYGAMWAGVPVMKDCWFDNGGGWMISTDCTENVIDNCYLRLCPAEPGAEVQYGFCPVRLSRSEELYVKKLGPQQDWKIKKLEVRSAPSSHFRIDVMLLAALRLGVPSNTSPEAEEFRRLLGSTPLDAFILDIARGCYKEGSSRQNILRDRDRNYRDALQLVCCQAYPDCLSLPIAYKDVDRIKHLMDLESGVWAQKGYLYPYAYNVVMPQEIFNLVSNNLEKDLPIAIPQYVTLDSWMFNGSWGNPCTGLRIAKELHASSPAAKLLAGTISKFNLDLPGKVSYWPPENNPPEGWVARFTDCLQELSRQALPPSVEERFDLALAVGRRIPVVFNFGQAGKTESRFARVLDHVAEPGSSSHSTLTAVTIKECSESGEVIESANPQVVTPEGTPQTRDSQACTTEPEEDTSACCTTCGEEHPLEHVESCIECEEPTCLDCRGRCENCGATMCYRCLRDLYTDGAYLMEYPLCSECRNSHEHGCSEDV